MKTNIFNRYQKMNHNDEDFGRGKSKNTKGRNRRAIKKKSKNRFEAN